MAEKILIVDDDVETVRLIGMMLQRQNFEVIAAQTGQQAIDLANAEVPNLIVLDVMMPDMDGYSVAKHLRNHAETAEIPILMFTARTQLEDKVSGFDAGADDYLTKPVHPAELIAHIRALLSRRQTSGSAAASVGYTLGLVAPKGGMGVSSTALCLAIALHNKTKCDVIAAELRPGMGSWHTSLGLKKNDGLTTLLKQKPHTITKSDVESQLVPTNYGIRLLLSSNQIEDVDLAYSSGNLSPIVTQLSRLAPFVVLDIGTPNIPGFVKIITQCKELLVISEAQPEALRRTRTLLDQFTELKLGLAKQINIAVVNRQRADFQVGIDEVTETLGITPLSVVPPGPEQAYQAAMRSLPLSYVIPDGIVATQLTRLADYYARVITK